MLRTCSQPVSVEFPLVGTQTLRKDIAATHLRGILFPNRMYTKDTRGIMSLVVQGHISSRRQMKGTGSTFSREYCPTSMPARQRQQRRQPQR